MIRAEVSAPDLTDLALAIRYENNGAVLRRDLVRNLRVAVKPAVNEAKESILSGGLHSLLKMTGTDERSMRSAIRQKVKTQVSLTTRSAKVKVRVPKGGYPRGFRNAPKAYNMAGGWRHPVIGTKKKRWVDQIGHPGWFDKPLRSHRAQYRAAVEAAMKATADRIARKV